MIARIVLRQFTPARAAEITGVPAGLQRQWRSQGFYRPPEAAGHTRYTAVELCALYAGRCLIDAGMTYKQAAPHLDLIARSTLSWLLDVRGALDGLSDPDLVGEAKRELSHRFGEHEAAEYLVLDPVGSSDATWDITEYMETRYTPVATIISVNALANRLHDRSGPIGTVVTLQRGSPPALAASVISRARAIARAHGVDLYSDEGLALARGLASAEPQL